MGRLMCSVCATILSMSCWTGAVVQEQETRTWSDESGKFSIKAKLVVTTNDKSNGPVTLVKEDGDQIEVDFYRLDPEGQKYVRGARRELKMKTKGDSNSGKSESSDDKQSKRDGKEEKSDNSNNGSAKIWNWRGPNLDGVSRESGLMQSWQGNAPELLWTANGLGKGMSSVAIGNGKIFTLGNRNGSEYLIGLDLSDGKEIWSTRVGRGGESNSTPTIYGDYVVGLGRGGDLVCSDIESGDLVWQRSFEDDFGGKMMSQWGFSESPLIDDGKVICTPGGPNAMMVALDLKTGKVIWRTPMKPGGQRGQDGAGYSSPVVSNAGGTKQYITLVGRGLISVNAQNGNPLWQYEKIANGTANVPTPIVDGDFVFCSSGYDDGGTALLKLSGRRGSVNWKEVYYRSANELQNHHGGMIKIGDFVYMGEGHNKGFPMCVNFMTGRPMWPKQRGAGSGSAAIVAADGHLYFRYENGLMALIEADPKNYKLKGTFQIATRNGKSWPHPVIFEGKLYLRDQQQLHCYSIKQ